MDVYTQLHRIATRMDTAEVRAAANDDRIAAVELRMWAMYVYCCLST